MITPEAKRSWWERNWKWAVPVGIAGTAALFAGVFAIIIALVFGLMRSTEVYRTAVADARAEPAVVAALGAPIEEGLFVTGNVEVNTSSGYADLAIPIAGPRGSATIYAEAEKASGRWGYSTLEVHVSATGETIDLLSD